MTSNQISPIYVRKRSAVIAVPYGYSDHDQLVGFIQSKFSGLKISVIHHDISKPEVDETEVEYDSSASAAEIARETTSNDSRSVMDEVAAAIRSRQVADSENAERLELPDPGREFQVGKIAHIHSILCLYYVYARSKRNFDPRG